MSDILTRLTQNTPDRLPDNMALRKKLHAITKGRIRLLTFEEYTAVIECDAWQNGYLIIGTVQVVVQKRDDGSIAAFRL